MNQLGLDDQHVVADAVDHVQQQQQQDHEHQIGFWDSITDERVNEFYLLRGGPSIVLTLVGVYLYFVLSLGPKLMSRRSEPYKLNKLLLVYNVSMALANLWLFIQGLFVSNYGLDTWGCGKFGGDIRLSPRRGIYLGYLFFLTKLIELLDTVFFVLRKKKEQVTFLHVFHHSIVPIFCWIGIKLAPGGPNGFFPLVNSFIHVIMYSYYALTTFGPRIQPYLWWKKYLTRLQMFQFVLVMVNAAKTFMSQDCKFPLLFSYLQALVACAFLILFGMFYHDAYMKRNQRNQQARRAQTNRTNKNNKNTQMIQDDVKGEDDDHDQDQNELNKRSRSKSVVAADAGEAVRRAGVHNDNNNDNNDNNNTNGALKWRTNTKKNALIV